jgi:nicotinamide mononucleotide transporter
MHLQLPEIIGFVAGVTCVLLGMYENVWNWPVGMASNIALFVLFRRNAVYAAAGLQLLYVAIAIYGWWNWLHKDSAGGKLHISRSNWTQRAFMLAATAAGAVALHWVLQRFTDTNVAWPDAAGTSLLLAAQYCLSRKLLECWFFWIVADVIYIAVYLSKGLYLAPGLYVFFLVMCVIGFIHWRRQEQAASLGAAGTSAA